LSNDLLIIGKKVGKWLLIKKFYIPHEFMLVTIHVS
jgi:hypothetical protein